MLKTRKLTCKQCGNDFETTAPGPTHYCGSACRFEAKKQRNAGYVQHKCKTCKKVVARYSEASTKLPPEYCAPCRSGTRIIRRIAEYQCAHCYNTFVSNYEKKYCTYTCKSNAEKNGIIYHAGDCRVCGKTEQMPQWRIEVAGLICQKCANKADTKRSAYATAHRKKQAACGSCQFAQREKQSTIGYICLRAIAAECKPLGEALHYVRQK